MIAPSTMTSMAHSRSGFRMGSVTPAPTMGVATSGRLQGRRFCVRAQKESSFFKDTPVPEPPKNVVERVVEEQASAKAAAEAAATAAAVAAAAASQAVVEATAVVANGADTKEDGLDTLLDRNNIWAASISQHDPEFFPSLAKGQAPEFLWIGCSDSRVVPNLCTGTRAGDVFVHRNVGNIVSHSDMNCMSALEFSIHALGVKHVIVCGHYGCGAVNAAMTLPQKSDGVTNCWINPIREVRNTYAEELKKLDFSDQLKFICEANAVRQAFNACTAPPVQKAWANGLELYVHAVIFDLSTGKIGRLAATEICTGSFVACFGPISSLEQASQAEVGQKKHLSTITKDLTDVLAFEKTM